MDSGNRARFALACLCPVHHAPQQIDGGNRSPNDWKDNGVYFLNESDCLKQVIECVWTCRPPSTAMAHSAGAGWGDDFRLREARPCRHRGVHHSDGGGHLWWT